MASVGTRAFWKAHTGSRSDSTEQILKLSGYVNIVLRSAHYRSDGNFWQRTFGGSDQITLTSQITYNVSSSPVSALTVQDVRSVKPNLSTFLPLARNLALKVPTDADGLEFRVQITAIREDNIQKVLSFLNTDEFRKPLELAVPVISQVSTISSLIKKAMTDSQKSILEASYPGIISSEPVDQPLETNRLVAGYLILLSANDESDEDLENIDVDNLSVVGDQLLRGGTPVKSTYIICSISLDSVRGYDTRATWFRKFQEAERKLNEMLGKSSKKQEAVYEEAIRIWQTAGALLDDDPQYIPRERTDLKKERLLALANLYETLKGGSKQFAGGSSVSVQQLLSPSKVSTEFDNETLAGLRLAAEDYKGRIRSAGLPFNWDEGQESIC